MWEMGERRKRRRVGIVKLLFAVMLGMILIPPLILTVQPAGMESQTAEVSIQGATVAQGETVEVPINITDVSDLGATTIWLSYDSSVVTVEDVSEGTLGGSLTVGINNTAGVTKMSWFSATGKTGDFVFAYVRLKAVGSPGDVSVLDLDVKKMVNTSFEPINYTVRDGTFSVKEMPLEADAGGPYYGYVGQPITLEGSATGGVPPYHFAWDLDNDGEYDDATGDTVTWTWSTAGTYTVGLQVTDSATPANVSTDDATVVVSEITVTLVSIQGATVAQGETVEVPINITDVSDLGATTIWLSYDSSVVTVEDVSEGTLGGSLTVGINNTAGVTKMSWFSATGKTGDFVFAYVRLKAVGSPGDVSVLDLDVKKMVNTSFEPINYTVRDGTFSVKAKNFFVSITPSNITVNKSETVLVDVRDADTGEPVEGATVDLSGCGVEMSNETNASGIAAFEVKATSTGNITVTVSKTGYNTWTKEDGIVVASIVGIGDMNGDGKVDFNDVIALAIHIYFGEPVYDNPDVNGDGKVDFNDVIALAIHIYFGEPIYPQ